MKTRNSQKKATRSSRNKRKLMVQTDHQGKHLIKKINFESLNESHGAKEEFSWLYD